MNVLREGEGLLVHGSPPNAATILFDREWLAPGPLFGILVEGGRMRWSDETDPVDAASPIDLVLQLAADAALAAGSRHPVDVLGAGAVAAAVRSTVASAAAGDAPPQAVIDTTGCPSTITAALARLRRGGLLVLAGESRGRNLELNVYRSVHATGAEVIGVPRPRRAAPCGTTAALPPAVRIPPDVPIPFAPWYQIGGD